MASYSILLMFHFTHFIASNPLFRNFEKTFSGQVIDPCNLTIKEQIGEGELMCTYLLYFLHLPLNPCSAFSMTTSQEYIIAIRNS